MIVYDIFSVGVKLIFRQLWRMNGPLLFNVAIRQGGKHKLTQ